MLDFCLLQRIIGLSGSASRWVWSEQIERNREIPWAILVDGICIYIYIHIYIYIYIYIYIPRTQMTPVLVRKNLVLRGLPSKIEVSWVLGVYIYNYIYIY